MIDLSAYKPYSQDINQGNWVELILVRSDLHRELADPNAYSDVKGLVLAHGGDAVTSVAYDRKGNIIPWKSLLSTGMSIVVVKPDDLKNALRLIATRPEILPNRMDWDII